MGSGATCMETASALTADEVTQIAKETYVHGYPMVMNYTRSTHGRLSTKDHSTRSTVQRVSIPQTTGRNFGDNHHIKPTSIRCRVDALQGQVLQYRQHPLGSRNLLYPGTPI